MDNTEPTPGALALAHSSQFPADSERTPTLMASADGGEVRVWKPTLQFVWPCLIGSGLLFLSVVDQIIRQAHRLDPFGWIEGAGSLFIWGFWFAWSYKALFRRCYLATDTEGIAISNRKGSRALRWSDIESLQLGTATSANSPMKVTLGIRKAGNSHPLEHTTLELYGYSEESRREMFRVILERTALRKSLGGRYVRTIRL